MKSKKCDKMVMKSDKKQVKSHRYLCLRLRQWALLASILLLIVTSLLALCITLGKFHTKEILDLLSYDIEDEEQKHHFEDGGARNNNLLLLEESQQRLSKIDNMVLMLMALAWLNVLGAMFAIPSVIYREAQYLGVLVHIHLITLLIECGIMGMVMVVARKNLTPYYNKIFVPLLSLVGIVGLLILILYKYYKELLRVLGMKTWDMPLIEYPSGPYKHQLKKWLIARPEN